MKQRLLQPGRAFADERDHESDHPEYAERDAESRVTNKRFFLGVTHDVDYSPQRLDGGFAERFLDASPTCQSNIPGGLMALLFRTKPMTRLTILH
jgi:hypothetical protein